MRFNFSAKIRSQIKPMRHGPCGMRHGPCLNSRVGLGQLGRIRIYIKISIWFGPSHIKLRFFNVQAVKKILKYPKLTHEKECLLSMSNQELFLVQ